MTANQLSTRDGKWGIQAFLVLDVFLRLLVWSAALAVTHLIILWMGLWPDESPNQLNWGVAWRWSQAFSTWVLIYNVVYLALIILLRLPIPTPREGRYLMRPGDKLDRQIIWSALLAVITKARYEAPFPAFLLYQISNFPLIRRVVVAILGPKSDSVNVTQPIIADPHLTHIGRNVVFGYGCSVSSHTQDRESVTIAATHIGDDVLVGAHSLIYGGCTIGRGAMIYGGAVVRPNTTIGENESWGGVPAIKIKDVPLSS